MRSEMATRQFVKKFTFIMLVLFTQDIYAYQAGTSYGGAHHALMSFTETGFPDIEPSVLVARYGYFVYNNIALEGRLGGGSSDDTASNNTYDFNVDISYLYGGYLVGHFPYSQKLNIYALAGVTQIDLVHTSTSTVATNRVSTADASYSYALGGDYTLLKNFYVNLEYARYYAIEEIVIDALSLGFSFKF